MSVLEDIMRGLLMIGIMLFCVAFVLGFIVGAFWLMITFPDVGPWIVGIVVLAVFAKKIGEVLR